MLIVRIYDEYGNCITKDDGATTWEYYYDDKNRLSSVTENGHLLNSTCMMEMVKESKRLILTQ